VAKNVLSRFPNVWKPAFYIETEMFMKKLCTCFVASFLSLVSLAGALAADKPVIFVTNEVVIDGKGTTGVQQINADLVRLVKSALARKNFDLSNSGYDYSIRFRVETDYDYGLFGAKSTFVKSLLILERNGAEVESISFDERTPAGSFSTYGKEGEAYAMKAADYLVSNLLRTELMAKFEKKGGESREAAKVTGSSSSVYNAAMVTTDSVGKMPKGKSAGKYDVAVIIGNRNYKKTSNVDYAGNDARKMKEMALRTMGFLPENIIYVEDATLSDFTEIFGSQRETGKSKLHNYIKSGVSNVFVYYVGHGAPDIQDEKPKAYFVPVDADPQYIGASGYKVQTLYDNLAKLPVKNITVVLDSCFSGNSPSGLLFKGISGLVVVDKSAKMTAKNSVVITSTSENQVSSWYDEKQHSLFTYFFLKGLQGEADKNRDRKITAGELEEYLAENVAGLSKRLTGNLQQPLLAGDRGRIVTTLE
jgi:hypothetical protein